MGKEGHCHPGSAPLHRLRAPLAGPAAAQQPEPVPRQRKRSSGRGPLLTSVPVTPPPRAGARTLILGEAPSRSPSCRGREGASQRFHCPLEFPPGQLWGRQTNSRTPYLHTHPPLLSGWRELFATFIFLFIRRGSGVGMGRESCFLMMKEGGRKEQRSVQGNVLSDEAVIRSYRWAGYLISYLTRGA